MSEFDIVIVGGGIAGASLGAAVAGKRRTLIIEAEEHCAMHATGRSAAFWLAHYGGAPIIPLTIASRGPLEQGWPTGERSFLRQRGAIVIGTEYRQLWDAMSVETDKAPRRKEIERAELESHVPGLRAGWDYGLLDASCADIDVAGLHNACLAKFQREGGVLLRSTALRSARRWGGQWVIEAGEQRITAPALVNAAGAWADEVAARCGVPGLNVTPYRRTVVQLRIGRRGLKELPLVIDGLGRFYFKGESDNRVWASPHDETASDPCDTAAQEIDVARAIDHFQSVVDWPIEAVERKWAGLRTFTPARIPSYGFDPAAPGFFWCVGQGGFGIQTAPAGAKLAASLLLDEAPDEEIAAIDRATFAPRRLG
ncbi:MAG: D-arginine dehydrogenase [Sphingomonadales bacterium]|nr:D-arginine dehydrogenase [Sphingomonadales bacterium]